MASILFLFDKRESGMRELLERFLSKSGYLHHTIEVTEAARVAASEVARQASGYGALLAHITSHDSPIWSLVKEVRESREGAVVPIIGILHFSPEVVGPDYEVWTQYHHLFTDYLTGPFGPEGLKALGDLIEKRSR